MATSTYYNFNECVETPMEFLTPTDNNTQPDRELAFKMYPNPANDWVAIELPMQTNGALITIVDLNGKVVLQERTSIPLYIWETYNLPQGVYVVNITNVDGTEPIGTQKIVIQH